MLALFQEKGAMLRVQILQEPAAQDFIEAHTQVLDSAMQHTPLSEGMRRRLSRSNYIFSGIKTFHELNEAFPSLVNKDGSRKPFEQFYNDVRKIDQTYNRNYLRAEYNFIQASAEMAAKWERFQQDGDRYDLQYRTANDGKVRPEHAELHGVTLPPSDPFWESYYPPNGWNCRCTVVQVRKGKFPTTPHDEAMERGEVALKRDKKGMFRFNPGIERKSVPDYNPYTIRRCKDCDIAQGKFKAAKTIVDSELCDACVLVRSCWKSHKDSEPETFTSCETKNGSLKVSSKHGSNEKKENVRIGTYLAEKHGYDITLLARSNDAPSADSFNATLNTNQEYKVNTSATQSSIDGLLRKGAKQAPSIVLVVESGISLDDLSETMNDRVHRSNSIQSVTVVIGNKDHTYTREDILKGGFKIQQADLE